MNIALPFGPAPCGAWLRVLAAQRARPSAPDSPSPGAPTPAAPPPATRASHSDWPQRLRDAGAGLAALLAPCDPDERRYAEAADHADFARIRAALWREHEARVRTVSAGLWLLP